MSAATLFAASAAQAQTAACDLLKASLGTSLEASGVRSYSLEAVPADAPVPAGTRVIGNCEAGAYKVLYRRIWSAAPASAAASGAAPSAAPAGTPAATSPTAAAASAATVAAIAATAAATSAARPATQAASRPTPPALPFAAASAPQAAGHKASAPLAKPVATERKPPAPTITASAANAAQAMNAAIDPGTGATVADASPAAERSATSSRLGAGEAASRERDAQPAGGPSGPARLLDFAAARWAWLAAAALAVAVALALAFGAGLRFWRARYGDYDAAGLPRGPKL